MQNKSKIQRYIDRQDTINAAIRRFIYGESPDDLTLDYVRQAMEEVFDNAIYLSECELKPLEAR